MTCSRTNLRTVWLSSSPSLAEGVLLPVACPYLQIEKELQKISDDILTVLDKHLIPSSSNSESKVFYYKM